MGRVPASFVGGVLEEDGCAEGGDGEEGKGSLFDGGGAFIGGGGQEKERCGEHGAGSVQDEGEPDDGGGEDVQGDAAQGLEGKEEVVKALVEGEFLGCLRVFWAHGEDGEAAGGPGEGFDVEDDDMQGCGSGGCDHSGDEHAWLFSQV